MRSWCTELEHALQFQTFRVFIQPRLTPDGELVRWALAEGDATLAEALWLRVYGQKSDAIERLAATGLTSEHGPSDWNVSHSADEKPLGVTRRRSSSNRSLM